LAWGRNLPANAANRIKSMGGGKYRYPPLIETWLAHTRTPNFSIRGGHGTWALGSLHPPRDGEMSSRCASPACWARGGGGCSGLAKQPRGRQRGRKLAQAFVLVPEDGGERRRSDGMGMGMVDPGLGAAGRTPPASCSFVRWWTPSPPRPSGTQEGGGDIRTQTEVPQIVKSA